METILIYYFEAQDNDRGRSNNCTMALHALLQSSAINGSQLQYGYPRVVDCGEWKTSCGELEMWMMFSRGIIAWNEDY